MAPYLRTIPATTRSRAIAANALGRTYRGGAESDVPEAASSANKMNDDHTASRSAPNPTPLGDVYIPLASLRGDAGDEAAGGYAPDVLKDESGEHVRAPARGRRRALSLGSSHDGGSARHAADDSILNKVPTLSLHGVEVEGVASTSRRPHRNSLGSDNNDNPLLDKGKGPDPRNWGRLDMRAEEQDPATQKALLDGFNRNRVRMADDDHDRTHAPRDDRAHFMRDEPPHRQYNDGRPARTPTEPQFRLQHAQDTRPINQLSQGSALGRLREREARYRSATPARPAMYARPAPPVQQPRFVPLARREEEGPHDFAGPVRNHYVPAYAPAYGPAYAPAHLPIEASRAPRVPLVEPKRYNGRPHLDSYIRLRAEYGTYVRRSRLPENEQVEVLSSFLEDKAYDFYLQRASADPERWDLIEFFDALFNHCFPKNFKSKLREELHHNRQGNRDVWAYVHDLTTKLETVGMTDDRERVHRLWTGFEPHIQESLWRDRLSPEQSTWEDIVESAEAAEQADRVLTRGRRGPSAAANVTIGYNGYNARDDATPRNGDNQRTPRPPQRNNDATPRAPNGQFLSNAPRYGGGTRAPDTRQTPSANRSQNANQGLTGGNNRAPARSQNPPMNDATRRAHQEGGQCYICHRPGHIARNCREANVVSNPAGGRKPPGMAAFNLEMEYDGDSGILEEMPVMAIGEYINAMLPEDLLDERHVRYSATHREAMNMGHRRPRTRDEFHEPFWMKYPKAPREVRRTLGDAFILMAEYHLNMQQPYPGDPTVPTRTGNDEFGMSERFGMYSIDDQHYGIYDRLVREPFTIRKELVEQPTFRLSRHYAQHRARVTRNPIKANRSKYSGAIGDALSAVTSCLLTDGIARFYPSQNDEIDDEDRFCVQIWNAQTDVFVINDYDRRFYVLIDGACLRNEKFNLIRWYDLVLAGERGFDAKVFPLDPPAPPEPDAPESDLDTSSAEAPVDTEADSDSDEPGAYDGMPDLQSISAYSYSSSEEEEDEASDSDDSDDSDNDSEEDETIAPLDMSDPERTQMRRSQNLRSDFAKLATDALVQGIQYPGDLMLTVHPATRFKLIPTADRLNYSVEDRERDLGLSVPVACLRNPAFDLGLWYAEHCARNHDLATIEQEIVRWRGDHPPPSTSIGVWFEQRMAFLLNMGEPYVDDEHYGYNDQVGRFVVSRDPTDPDSFIIFDKRREVTRRLPAADAEAPNFPIIAWYETECEMETFRCVCVEDDVIDLNASPPPSSFSDPSLRDCSPFAALALRLNTNAEW
ncbi:hypothetical protein D9611_014620 [Ephemerocybe angulata]|uniref:CCHC-type domain-containing protein n=1 Tax=Ephemerocybe angulata TaxID=980116 RepID=A0A8H5CAK0_9AGAR|nr:hypothetical protein D9611_014620 [Tulosesus angulatus]